MYVSDIVLCICVHIIFVMFVFYVLPLGVINDDDDICAFIMWSDVWVAAAVKKDKDSLQIIQADPHL